MGNQEQVDIFMNQYSLNIKPEYRAMDIAAEFGEVAKQILKQTNYGEKEIKRTENLELELGDLYFSLIALANTLNIDLDLALDRVVDKYKERIEGSGDPGSD